ncbi:hypothetical protein VTO42DRAFT_8558 [Malbranchea cinnamomea]
MPSSTKKDHYDDYTTLDPKKYDPSRSMEVPIVYDSHISYSSVTDSTSSSSRQATWKMHPDLSDPRAPTRGLCSAEKSTDSSQYSRYLPQSKSDGNVKSFNECIQEDTAFAEKLYGNWGSGQTSLTQDHTNLNRSPEGARGRHRSRSPAKRLEDVDEDNPLEFLIDPPRKRSRSPHKKLFGENGWLGRTPDIGKDIAEKHKKAGLKGLSERIKQRVEDITGSNSTPPPPKLISSPRVPTSLDPPTQAKLYSELELMICATANRFLIEQYNQGRMSPESIAKVTNFWASKNRPQVVQFQFDQLTQRDLILYNIRTMAFHGDSARNPIILNATMYDWKAVAKEMSVRTFCYPDSVIRKHMHDTHKILEMLGAPLVTFLAFQELQVNALAMMKSADEKKLTKPAGAGSGHWYLEEHRHQAKLRL